MKHNKLEKGVQPCFVLGLTHRELHTVLFNGLAQMFSLAVFSSFFLIVIGCFYHVMNDHPPLELARGLAQTF